MLDLHGHSVIDKSPLAGPAELARGEHVPHTGEIAASGPKGPVVAASTLQHDALLFIDHVDLIRAYDAQYRGTARLRARVLALAQMVKEEFPGFRLRITSAWRAKAEGATGHSFHYEGRAADLTVIENDPAKIQANQDDARKLGRLARLAVHAGFDWVFYEDNRHIHVSVRGD